MAKPVQSKLEVFVIHYNGTPLHMVKERWNEWRPTKKIYHSMSAAKIGMNYIPNMIKDNCEIVRYTPEGE
jgi:hypothetical protein